MQHSREVGFCAVGFCAVGFCAVGSGGVFFNVATTRRRLGFPGRRPIGFALFGSLIIMDAVELGG